MLRRTQFPRRRSIWVTVSLKAGASLTSNEHAAAQRSPRGPVVLATLASRPHADAEDAAIGAALESGAPLVIVNAVALPMLPLTLQLVGLSAAIAPEKTNAASNNHSGLMLRRSRRANSAAH